MSHTCCITCTTEGENWVPCRKVHSCIDVFFHKCNTKKTCLTESWFAIYHGCSEMNILVHVLSMYRVWQKYPNPCAKNEFVVRRFANYVLAEHWQFECLYIGSFSKYILLDVSTICTWVQLYISYCYYRISKSIMKYMLGFEYFAAPCMLWCICVQFQEVLRKRLRSACLVVSWQRRRLTLARSCVRCLVTVCRWCNMTLEVPGC